MKDQLKIDKAVDTLDAGGVILFKTDTIWGIGCDATSAEAIEKVYKLKRRSHDKPFIVLMDHLDRVKDYVISIHPRIETLLSFHRRPLTVIYNNPKNLPQNLTSKNNTIAIRITTNDKNVKLIEKFGKPLVATSANFSGKQYPKNFDEISDNLKDKVDYILELENDSETLTPSTMVKFTTKGELVFIRD